MTVRIINSDVLDGLRSLPDESVHCVVTSPPYWGLRDYGVAGQIGLEPTHVEFIGRLVDVFREVRRVLRNDGTLWLNMGDSYAGAWGAQSRGDDYPGTLDHPSRRTISARQIAAHPNGTTKTGSLKRTPGLKPKDLMGMPWRLAFALQDDGWWLRQDIIWAKPNPMPESVTDRCTKAHEYLFLITKAERYHFDADAIAEVCLKTGTEAHLSGGSGVRAGTREGLRKRPSVAKGGFGGKAANSEQPAFRAVRDMRNKRSVWTVPTVPFTEAHFATFPPELPEICIKAGCPPGGTVLDPFSGAGATALVADRLQRHAIGIELNPDYVAMSLRRIHGDAPLFAAS